VIALVLVAAAAAAAPPPKVTIASMQGRARVLILSAPREDDPALRRQREELGRWRRGAEARDLHVVTVAGPKVHGASDGSLRLRLRYRLAFRGFTAVLIGKDGGVKLRRDRPIPIRELEAAIDAMPMRKAGLR